jgi:hypothetical protein
VRFYFMYVFWLPLWYLVAIMLSALRCTSSDYPFGVLWPLCCLPFDVRLLITPLVSCGHYVVCPSMYVFWLPLWCLVAIMLSALRCTSSAYPFGVLWPLCCLSFDVRLLITPLVSCGHYVVCPSMYVFWLPLWCLVAIMLSALRCTLLITPLVSCGHCVVCPSMYVFWLSLWCLVAIMLSAFRCTLLITPLVSCGHCVICPSMYVFWLPLWCFVAIMLSALRCRSSDYPLWCLQFFLTTHFIALQF